MRIVFVHGVGGSEAAWAPQLARFPQSVAVTLPGHPTGQGCRRIDDYVDWLHGWIAERRIDRFLLVGHSMGGAIAQAYTRRYPDQVWALGLFATGARLRVRPDLLDGVLLDFPAFARSMVDWALGPNAPQSLKESFLRDTLAVSPQTIRGDWEACDGFDNLAGLAGIHQPTLIVAGAEDRLTPLKYSEYFHQHLPNSRLVVLPGIGHYVQLEAPEAVNEALAQFLEDLEADRPIRGRLVAGSSGWSPG